MTHTNKKTTTKTLVLFAVGILLLLLEIAKQALIIHHYSAFSWSDFPFQLCSIPMYLCLAYPLLKRGRSLVEAFLRSFGLIGGLAAFIFPYDILNPYLPLALHSITWHLLLLFLGAYCIVTPSPSPSQTPHSKRNNALFYLALAISAILLNAALFKVSHGAANMFFLGPSKPCVLILDDICNKFGWIAESIVMILASEIAGMVVLVVEEKIRAKKLL